jgi:hypothetical protein
MIFGILFLAIMVAVGYFALVGIKATIDKHQNSQGLEFIRDILKYAALFLSVFFLSFGISGLLTEAIDPSQVAITTKEDVARWLSFVFVGVPVVVILTWWIKRDFAKEPSASSEPAWQLYLVAATSFSFLTWFLFMTGSLNVLAGANYNPKGIAGGLIAFAIWLVHVRLINEHRSLMANIHRFIGWFAGATGLVIASTNLLEWIIKKATNQPTSSLLIQESVIAAALSLPTAIYYWQNFDLKASLNEIRAYRYLGGQVIPALFATIAATLTVNTLINWVSGRDANWDQTASTTAAAIVLFATIYLFRRLLRGYERDELTRLYQYLISAMAMTGIAISVGALIAGSLDKTDQKDAIIFGASLIMTTLPTWWLHWRKCQFAMAIDFEVEHEAPIRRIYLYGLIGIPTLVALGSSVWVVFAFFKALLIGGLDQVQLSTPLGILISTGLVALFHLRVLQKERVSIN